MFERVRRVLASGWHDLSDYDYGGTGAPGKILEKLLGVDSENFDIPDAGKWEVKFHSGSALLTLFHRGTAKGTHAPHG
ncbi:MAG: MvaI/BcnI family restriction endonuclease [Thaumarchaeota archaeon]|nr:MvaI/BcnI family restriction endonuclease [Nitrososphaerota archaeon]MDE0525307.1 MvaI/BcnI family restriction endonuclease [Nitrososphaerota archaeon]